ncbi:hypothetical protein PG988_006665 [Apiospora saccharicola]
MDMIDCPYEEVPEQNPHLGDRDIKAGAITSLSDRDLKWHLADLRRRWEEERDNGAFNCNITLGVPYPPCTRPVCDLGSTTLSEMVFGGRHLGKKILLQIVDFFERIDQVCALVKDEEDRAAIMELYHVPNGGQGPAGEPLKKGQAVILKEPTFGTYVDTNWKISTSKWTSLFLGVDHVTDVVWMDMEGTHVPEKWRDSFLSGPEVPVRPPLLAPGPTLRPSVSEPDNDDFLQMYWEAQSDPPLVDYATFSTPVEVRQSLPGRGSGLFTKQAVSAGGLLLCEKALGYAWYHCECCQCNQPSKLFFSETKTGLIGGQARLLSQVINKLRLNPELYSQFQQLYRGEYQGAPELVVDGHPVVDTFHVAKVIALNGMGAPRSSRTVFMGNMRRDFPTQPSYYSCGLWALASRINHCCLANCRRSFIGDMLILRATKDLAAGTELFINYCDGPGGTPTTGSDVQGKLTRVWGITCQCTLCSTYKDSPPEPLLAEPRRLFEQLVQLLDPSLVRPDFVTDGARSMLRQLENMEELKDLIARLGTAPVPHFEFALFCMDLAYRQKRVEDFSAAAINALRCLELLGFEITAHPFDADIIPSVQNQFLINSWGVANDTALRAFELLLEVYGERHPALLSVIRGYGRRLYSMVVGQEATVANDSARFGLEDQTVSIGRLQLRIVGV